MKLFAILGLFLIFHSGYWFMQTKKYSKKIGQEISRIPFDVKKPLKNSFLLNFLLVSLYHFYS